MSLTALKNDALFRSCLLSASCGKSPIFEIREFSQVTGLLELSVSYGAIKMVLEYEHRGVIVLYAEFVTREKWRFSRKSLYMTANASSSLGA